MNGFNKYFGLMALLFGAVAGFVLLVVGLFYLLKLFSVTLFYIPGFENVANLDKLPVKGAFIIALPMKIKGGSGGPLRIVAIVPGE